MTGGQQADRVGALRPGRETDAGGRGQIEQVKRHRPAPALPRWGRARAARRLRAGPMPDEPVRRDCGWHCPPRPGEVSAWSSAAPAQATVRAPRWPPGSIPSAGRCSTGAAASKATASTGGPTGRLSCSSNQLKAWRAAIPAPAGDRLASSSSPCAVADPSLDCLFGRQHHTAPGAPLHLPADRAQMRNRPGRTGHGPSPCDPAARESLASGNGSPPSATHRSRTVGPERRAPNRGRRLAQGALCRSRPRKR